MLEAGIHHQVHRGAGVKADLGADERGEGVHRGGLPKEGAEEDQGLPTVEGHRVRDVVVEAARAVPGVLRQDGPQLHAMEDVSLLGGDLGVAGAGTGGHEVDLAGADDSVDVLGVIVPDLAGEQPGDGLEPGVRVRRDVHPAGGGDVVGTVVVAEAPGPDETAAALRQGAVHGHRAGPAERDIAGGDDLDRHSLTCS